MRILLAGEDAALAKAGLTLDQVTRMHVEWESGDDYLDHHHDGHHADHGVYEVSFRQDGYEYECVVDCATGEVLEYEREFDEAMSRGTMYREFEQEARERVCNLYRTQG